MHVENIFPVFLYHVKKNSLAEKIILGTVKFNIKTQEIFLGGSRGNGTLFSGENGS